MQGIIREPEKNNECVLIIMVCRKKPMDGREK